MIRDITLGQYYSASSFIHKLDARVKIICTLVFLVALFLVKSYAGFIVPFVGLAVVIGMSKVPLSFILRGLKPVFIIILFTFLLNLFMIDGDVLVQLWIFHITKEGLRTAVFMAIRVILLIIGSSLLTFTTKPVSLTDGLEKLGAPLKVFKVPTHELAMMMTIALRFIPTLLDETDKIMKAQQARGADFESGNIIKRAKSLMPVIVPLFISAFRIAKELAVAMEARCYNGDKGRTRMNQMKIAGRDVFACLMMALFTAAVIYQNYFMVI